MKDFFKFKRLVEENGDKPSRASEGQFADEVIRSEEEAIKEAEKRSQKAGQPNYSVYQNRNDYKEFKVCVCTDSQDLEKWRLLGIAKNGTYKREYSAERKMPD